MNNLPISKVPGIGKVHQRILSGLGIVKCKDIVDKAADLYVCYTENQFRFFIK